MKVELRQRQRHRHRHKHTMSMLRSYAVKLSRSNTCFSVSARSPGGGELRSANTSMWGETRICFLMKRSRCFWFMHEAACTCVSTCARNPSSRLATPTPNVGHSTAQNTEHNERKRETARAHLPNVVEVAMRHCFLLGCLVQLVQQRVHPELCVEEREAPVRKRLLHAKHVPVIQSQTHSDAVYEITE